MKLTDLIKDDSSFISPEFIEDEKKRLEKQKKEIEARKIAEELFHINKKPITKIKLPSRNDKCPCGSGKKYKNCCIEIDQQLIKKWQRE